MSNESVLSTVNTFKHDKSPLNPGIGESESGLVSDTLEELFNDQQSGDFVLVGGFEPRRLAEYYIGHPASDSGNAKAQKIEELVDMLVDRIFISDSTGLQGEELQLKLVNGVIHGAEVWFKRDKGDLQLEIHTKTSKSTAFFVDNSKDFTSSLEEALNESVTVAIVSIEEEQS
jgi:hypothetical protein